MKKIAFFFFLSSGCLSAQSQDSVQIIRDTLRHKIAIFTPLYLDSAFDKNGRFRYEKTGAKISENGLEFYYGVQMALDSLAKRGAPLEVYIYDTKGKETIQQQLAKDEMKDVELIIAQSSAAETRKLAGLAQVKKVPFISATLPNDAGVYNNPYYVVLNPTIKAHVEGIYRFLQKYHALDKIVVFRRKGAQEDMLKGYFDEIAKKTMSVPVDIEFVNLENNFSNANIESHLDSSGRTVCIAGSLNEGFGLKLTQTLETLNKEYPVRVIGMPTWDNFNFKKMQDLEIIYTTPFYHRRGLPLEAQLADELDMEMSIPATNLFYRGYETTLRFALLLLDAKKDIASNLSRKGNTVLTPFDIQPVFNNKQDMTLDYFENKNLFYIKVLGGARNILN